MEAQINPPPIIMRYQRRTLLLAMGPLAMCGPSIILAASIPMNEKTFWQLVDAVKGEAGTNVESRPAILENHLLSLAPQDIQGFQQRYEALLIESNSWDLWGAAYLMNGGCSDDGFKYFRDWLISEGEDTFKQAVANPDALATVARRDYFALELFGYAAFKAYATKGAGELERDFTLEFAVTTGDEWLESDLPDMFPNLVAKYPPN